MADDNSTKQPPPSAAGTAQLLEIFRNHKKFAMAELTDLYNPSVDERFYAVSDAESNQPVCGIKTFANELLQVIDLSSDPLLLFAVNINDLIGTSVVCLPSEHCSGKQQYKVKAADPLMGQIDGLTRLLIHGIDTPFKLHIQSVNGQDVVNIIADGHPQLALLSGGKTWLSIQTSPNTDSRFKAVTLCLATKLFKSILGKTLVSQKQYLDANPVSELANQMSGLGVPKLQQHRADSPANLSILSQLRRVLITKEANLKVNESSTGKVIASIKDGISGQKLMQAETDGPFVDSEIEIKSASNQTIFYFKTVVGLQRSTETYINNDLKGKEEDGTFYDLTTDAQVMKVVNIIDESARYQLSTFSLDCTVSDDQHPIAKSSCEIQSAHRDVSLEFLVQELPASWVAMVLSHLIERLRF